MLADLDQDDLRVYMIAGEASGDALGAKLMKELRAQHSSFIEFYGIGGEHMIGQGMQSLFPMSELSIMGFVEIIPKIPHFLKRIEQTVADILAKKPDIVVTIDSPGFNFRIAAKLQGSGIKLMHYVAPTVWAYKPERAEKISKLYNHLLLLLPFEPPYFDEVGLANSFIGHPIVEEEVTKGDAAAFRQKHKIADESPLICILPGSRKTETNKMLPVFDKVVRLLAKKHPKLVVSIPAIRSVLSDVEKFAKKLPVKAVVTHSSKEKYDSFAAANAILAKSGTGSLEASMSGNPVLVAYKVGRISAHMAKKMIKIKYVNLINLILDEEVIPEFIQDNCRPELIAAKVEEMLSDKAYRENQYKLSMKALDKIGYGKTPTPSQNAAKAVLDLIGVKSSKKKVHKVS